MVGPPLRGFVILERSPVIRRRSSTRPTPEVSGAHRSETDMHGSAAKPASCGHYRPPDSLKESRYREAAGHRFGGYGSEARRAPRRPFTRPSPQRATATSGTPRRTAASHGTRHVPPGTENPTTLGSADHGLHSHRNSPTAMTLYPESLRIVQDHPPKASILNLVVDLVNARLLPAMIGRGIPCVIVSDGPYDVVEKHAPPVLLVGGPKSAAAAPRVWIESPLWCPFFSPRMWGDRTR